MENRKTGKELRKEYRDILDKDQAIRNQIIRRAEGLIKIYPDVKYMHSLGLGRELSVSEIQKVCMIDVNTGLDIIEKIEAHIASLHPHQQGNLFVINTTGSKIEKK